MSIESIDLDLLAGYVHEVGPTIESIRRKATLVAELQERVAAACGGRGHATTRPRDAVDLAVEMEELRVDCEDVWAILHPSQGSASAGSLGGWAGSQSFDSSTVAGALGSDFGPEAEDLPPDERERYRRLRDEGVGEWQAFVLAGHADPERKMREVVDVLSGDVAPTDIDFAQDRLLYPPGYRPGQELDPLRAILTAGEHGTLSHRFEGTLHGEAYLAGANWSLDYATALGERLAAHPEMGAGFYSDLEARDVAEIANHVPRAVSGRTEHQQTVANFGDGLAHATRLGAVSFGGGELVEAAPSYRNYDSEISLLFRGREPFAEAFLVSAASQALNKDMPWRNVYLAKVASQNLGAEFVIGHEARGRIDTLLDPDNEFDWAGFVERYGDDGPWPLDDWTVPPVTAVLFDAGVARQPEDAASAHKAQDIVIETVASWTEYDHVYEVHDVFGADWDPAIAAGVELLLIEAIPRHDSARADSIVGVRGSTDPYMFVAASVFEAGLGDALLLGSIGSITDAQAQGGSEQAVVNRAAFSGELAALHQYVGILNGSAEDAAYERNSETLNGLALLFSVYGLGSTASSVVGIGLSVVGAGLHDPEAVEGFWGDEYERLLDAQFLVPEAVVRGELQIGDWELNGEPIVMGNDQGGRPAVLLPDGSLVTHIEIGGETHRLDLSNPDHIERFTRPGTSTTVYDELGRVDTRAIDAYNRELHGNDIEGAPSAADIAETDAARIEHIDNLNPITRRALEEERMHEPA